jgi:hypothetical protein
MRRRIEDDEDERPARPYITPELVEAVERHVATGHAVPLNYRSRATRAGTRLDRASRVGVRPPANAGGVGAALPTSRSSSSVGCF